MIDNFKCPKTGQTFFISKYTMKIKGDLRTYVDKYGVEIINPSNGEKLIPIEKEGEYEVANVSGSKQQKGKMLDWMKKRSKNHFKKEIKEYKDHLVKQSIPGA